jgi:hypothetical protein
MLSHRRQGGQDGQRIRPAHNVKIEDPAAVLAQPQPLSQEEEVELTRSAVWTRWTNEESRSGCPTEGRSTPSCC